MNVKWMGASPSGKLASWRNLRLHLLSRQRRLICPCWRPRRAVWRRLSRKRRWLIWQRRCLIIVILCWQWRRRILAILSRPGWCR